MGRLEVIVLDSHLMMGQAIGGVLAEVAGLDVTGICRTTGEACHLIQASPPHLMALDVELGADDYRNAADLLHRLKPNAELLFITALGTKFKPPPDLAPYTIGIVDKANNWDDLLRVVRHWWNARPEQALVSLPGCDRQLEAIDHLKPRERRVLLELGHGELNKEIAANLGLSPATVESYRKDLAAKLGVSGAALVRLAVLYRCLRWHPSQLER